MFKLKAWLKQWTTSEGGVNPVRVTIVNPQKERFQLFNRPQVAQW